MNLRSIPRSAALCLALPLVALAWTVPGPVVITPDDALDPKLCVDSAGKAHVVWRQRISGGLFHVWYTDNSSGSFAAPVTVSQGGSAGGGSPVVAVSGDAVHVAWSADLGNYEIWYRQRLSGTWGPFFNASNTGIKSLRPAIAARGTVGPVVAWDEAIYADDNYDTFFSEWTGSGFGTAVNVSNTPGGAVYGSVNVNVAVAPNGDVMAVWADRISGDYHVNARRRVGEVWQTRQELSSLATGPSTPGIAAGSDNRFHVIYEAQGDIWYQAWNGGTWTAPVSLPGGLNSDIRPRIAVDENGSAYVVADAFTDSQNNRDIFFTHNASGVWPTWRNVSSTPGTQSINGEIGYGNGLITITWQENSNGSGGTGLYRTWFVIAEADFNSVPTPPPAVPVFVVKAGDTTNTLSWTNPSSPGFLGTVVRFKTAGFPTGPGDGELLADRPAASGSADALVHSGLTNSLAYYYAAFAYAGTPDRSYANGTYAVGTPGVKPDFDRDGDVDQTDFGRLQACLTGDFIAQTDPACQDALMDGDDDVDADDLARFINCFRGPGLAALPACSG